MHPQNQYVHLEQTEGLGEERIESQGVLVERPTTGRLDANDEDYYDGQQHPEEDEGAVVVVVVEALSQRKGGLVLGVVASLAYCCTYFWRYPVFMLPPEILHTTVVTFGDNSDPLDLQACFSLAFIGGFGVSKLLGMQLLSSSFFFRNRLSVLLSMVLYTMLMECVGVYVFQSIPLLQVLSVFLASFVQSWIYGALITYLEGRENTESLLAVLNAATVAAGGMSRGSATLVLNLLPSSVNPLLMPLLIGIVMASLACLFLVWTDAQPKPSRTDQASRCERQPMTPQQQVSFFQSYSLGMFGIYLAYALLVGVRSFRDFYSEQIFTAALLDADESASNEEVPSWVYLIADMPGALLSALVIYGFQRYSDHQEALSKMMLVSILFGFMVIISTWFFYQNLLGGLAWQLCLGTGLYGSFGILTTAIHERLIAATRTSGTCTFLVLMGDACAYLVTITILLVRDFGGGQKSSDDESTDDTFADEVKVLDGFLNLVYSAIGAGIVALFLARVYFGVRLQNIPVGSNSEGPFTADEDDDTFPSETQDDSKNESGGNLELM